MTTSKVTTSEALIAAVDAHKAGRFNEADRLYSSILAVNPKHPDANHNIGILASNVGKFEKAISFFQTAININPKIDQFWISLLEILLKLDRIDDALTTIIDSREYLKKNKRIEQLVSKIANHPIEEDGDPLPEPDQQRLVEIFKAGEYSCLLNEVQNQLLEYPSSANLFFIRGIVYFALDNVEEAISSYKNALQLNPTHYASLVNLGAIHKDLKAYDIAILYFKSAIKKYPSGLDAHYNYGVTLLSTEAFDAAVLSFKKCILLSPKHTLAHFQLANIYKENSNIEEAKTHYEESIRSNPSSTAGLLNFGNLQRDIGNIDEAIQLYRRALEIDPKMAEAFNNLGNAERDLGLLESSIENFKKAIQIKPDYAAAILNLGISLKDFDDLDGAKLQFEKAMELNHNFATAHRQFAHLNKYKYGDPHLHKMQCIEETGNLTLIELCNLKFGLAKAFEDMEEWSQSFKYLSEANAIRHKLLRYNIENDIKLFTSIKLKNEELKKSRHKFDFKNNIEDITPVFILGMPRSGTTLVEQIISSHTEVFGAGELNIVHDHCKNFLSQEKLPNYKQLLGFQKYYFNFLKYMSDTQKFVTDKMPNNFRYINWIALVFPNAKIVHVRRDPRAICWSCFKHYFASDSMGHMYNLSDLVHYYQLYDDLMRYWEVEYPSQLITVRYDELVLNPKKVSRTLINELGLDWDPNCATPEKNKRSVRTASQQQVRRKIYAGSSQDWIKFQPFIGAEFETLPDL